MHLSDAVRLFLGEYKPTTRRSYAQCLDDMVGYVGAKRPMSDITAPELLRYIQNVRSRETVKSAATVNKYIKTIKVFFNWSVRYELVVKSPAKPLGQEKQKSMIQRVKAMPDAELTKLMNYTQYNARLNAIVLFLADTGCRRGGAAGLKWSQVNFETMSAIVTEKGDKTRPVFFESRTRDALLVWREEQNATAGDFVFSLSGESIRSSSIAQAFRRACQMAKIGSWGPHSLRHRKGFQGADARIAPSVMATLLGHDNVETTLTSYYPRDYKRAEEAARELAIKPKNGGSIVQLPNEEPRTSTVTTRVTSR